MDRLIVERKLDSLQRCIRRIRDKRPDSVEALAADVDLQDVLVLNLSRTVQVCVDLAAHLIAGLSLAPPNTMGEAFDRLVQGELLDAALAVRMKKAVGFRNIAVHAYDTIDWAITFAIATRHLQDFEDFARVVVRWLDGDKAS
ncbi:MAG: DUF86 domain-containing protein [Lysobacteraceae bacterium]